MYCYSWFINIKNKICLFQEIKNIKTKASNIINTLSHLKQKLYFAQEEKIRALSTEKQLEGELNKVRTSHTLNLLKTYVVNS